MNHHQIMISNFSVSIHGPGSYTVVEGHINHLYQFFFFLVLINGQNVNEFK